MLPRVWMVIALVLAAKAMAQGTIYNSGPGFGTQYADQANDPMQIDMLFKEGAPIADILKGLKKKGFPIDFKPQNVPPSMILLSLPKATQIDDVLREILEPWHLDLYHSPYGKWVIRPTKQKVSSAEAK